MRNTDAPSLQERFDLHGKEAQRHLQRVQHELGLMASLAAGLDEYYIQGKVVNTNEFTVSLSEQITRLMEDLDVVMAR